MLEYKALSAGETASLLLSPNRGFHDGAPAPRSGHADPRAPATARAERNSRPAHLRHQQPVPKKILQSFNTWSFKREQPANVDLMLQAIAEAAALGKPVPFVLYWGKGPRCTFAAPDLACLDYLSSLARRVGDAYEPGAAITLIFTDTHAKLNGHTPESAEQYFNAVADAGRLRGFGSCRLGDLTRAAAAVVAGEPTQAVPEATLSRLAACAAKWYRGDDSAVQAALKYYRMNMVEKRAVELAFPRSIFITFNGSEFRELFPDRLGIFYMYSLRRGVSVKPWFLPAAD